MRISRTRKMVIDLGHYEKLEFSVTVTMGHEDLGLTDEDLRAECGTPEGRDGLVAELITEIMRVVNEELGKEIASAAELTAEEKSVLIREQRKHHESTTSLNRSSSTRKRA